MSRDTVRDSTPIEGRNRQPDHIDLETGFAALPRPKRWIGGWYEVRSSQDRVSPLGSVLVQLWASGMVLGL